MKGMAEPQQTPALSDAIRKARLDVVFRGHPASLGTSVVLATLAVVALWQLVDRQRLLLWYVALMVVTAARTLLWVSYVRHRKTAGATLDVEVWARRLFIGAMLAGTAWGHASLTLVPTSLTVQLFLCFVLAGNAAAAVTTLSADRRTAIAFIFTSLIPLTVQLLSQSSGIGRTMGVMVCIFTIMIAVSIHRFHGQILEMLSTRIEAEAARAIHHAQREVEALNRRLRIATHAAKVGIFEHDLVHGRIVWSAQNCAIFGLDPATPITAEQWRAHIHEADRSRVEAAFAGNGGQDEFEIEYRIVCAKGLEHDLKAACSIERSARGTAVNLIGMNWDITELRRVDRMKSEFVSIVSHELRTPLTSIRGALGIVGSGAAGQISDKVRDLTALAARNAERLSVLIDDILDIEKMESGRMRFDLLMQPVFPLLEQAIAANLPYAGRHGVHIKLRSPYLGAHISTDANRFLQVLANLLSNAAKFSPPGSCVEVACQQVAGNVRISVRDYGRGIAEEFRAKIFGKFSQGDASDTRARGGSGLGLAISRTIVELMGGAIGFVSHEVGTTFFFELPLCRPDDSGSFTRTLDLPVELT
jgi:signal transduction histidine kinase